MKERSLGTVCLRRLAIVLVLGLASALTGCTGFFVPVSSSSGSGSSGSGSTFPTGTDYAYVANATTMTLSGFLIGSGGTLSSVPNMPYTLGFVPTSLVMHPSDKFLYVAGASAIYCLEINSDGSISTSITQAGVAIVTTTAIDISPDGNWLVALDATNYQVDVYKINQTSGALTAQTPVSYGLTSAQLPLVKANAIKVAPSGGLVFAALGQAGDIVFTLNESTGALVNVTQIPPFSGLTSDNDLAIDSTSTYLFIARTGVSGGLAVYSIGSNDVLTQLNNGTAYTAGAQPTSVTLGDSGKYVYVGNGNAGTISGYTIGLSAALTPLSGSPYASGAQVSAVSGDNSGNFILATAFNGGPDLTMYSFDTTVPGKLDVATTAQTGSDPAGAVAMALAH